MAWRFWRWTKFAPRVAPAHSEPSHDELPLGSHSVRDFARLDAFFAKHQGEILAGLLGDRNPRVHGESESPEPLPDFGWPYEAVGFIGQGATGRVFLARDGEFSRHVAIKVSHPGAGAEESRVYQALLDREQRQLGPLKHDNVVHVYRTGRLADGRAWYAMEFVEGVPLTEYATCHSLNTREVIVLAEVVVRAIGGLHDRRIMHGDLKPGHVLVDEAGKPKVIDFGMARVIAAQADSKSSDAESGGSCVGGGTPGYRAPELARQQRGDFRADVYSLGVILHEVVTGRLPEQSHETCADLREHCHSGEDDIRRSKKRLPAELGAVIRKCLAEKPSERFADATQLADEVLCWLHGHPVAAFEMELPRHRLLSYRARKLAGRHRWATTVFGLTICLALTVVASIRAITSRTTENKTLAAAQLMERQRTADERRRADADQDRVETEQHRSAIQSARELLAQRRVDDARRALDRVPFSRRGLECDILTRQFAEFPTRQRVVGTHDWGVITILTSPGHVVSAGHDGRLLIWDLASGGCRTLRDGHWSQEMQRYAHVVDGRNKQHDFPDAVVSLAWLEPGESFVAGSLSGMGTIWHFDGHSRELIRHDRPLLVVATAQDGHEVIFGDDRGTIISCQQNGGEVMRTAIDGGAALTAAAAAPASAWWIGDENGVVRLLDAATRKEICQTIVEGPVRQLAAAPGDRAVAVACDRGAATVYAFNADLKTLQKKWVVTLPSAEQGIPRAVHAVEYSPSGDRLFLVDDLGRLIGLNARDGSVDFVCEDQGASPLPVAEVERWPWPLRRRSAGIGFVDAGQTLVTAGDDTLIKAWRLAPPGWARELNVGERPLLAFDPLNPTLLWVAAGDGRLLLIDAQSAFQCDSVQAGSERIETLAIAKNGIVATADQRSVHVWRAVESHIHSIHTPISCDGKVRFVALSPDGQHVAAYLESGQLQLRDVSSGRLLATRSLGALSDNTAGGLSAFNASGKQLGVLGSNRSVFLLAGRDLSILATLPLFAGQGGTALVWHPQEDETLFAGDTVGRVVRRPDLERASLPDDWTGHAPIVAIAVTSDGRRLLVATPNGRIFVVDPEWSGPLLSFDTPLIGKASPLTGMALNRTDRLLATARHDGTVCILSIAEVDRPRPQPTRVWSESVCCRDADAAKIRVRPTSSAVDGQGYLHVLYLKAKFASATADPKWQLILGRETKSGWQERTVRELSHLSNRAVDAVQRSLALAIHENRWQATAKLDPVSGGDRIAGLHLLGGSIREEDDAIEHTELILGQGNDGFDPVLVNQGETRPSVLHFTHAGHYLKKTWWTGEQWATSSLGRQGDGYQMHAASADGRLVHLLFQPTRFNGDHSLPVCLSVNLDEIGDSVGSRRLFTSQAGASPLAVTLSSGSEPIVLYRVGTPDGQSQLRLARWDGDQWRHRPILEREPPRLTVSNLATDSSGSVSFVAKVHSDGQIWFVSVADGPPKIEKVWQDPDKPIGAEAINISSGLYFSPSGTPVVLVVRDSPRAGYIRVFRPQLSAR